MSIIIYALLYLLSFVSIYIIVARGIAFYRALGSDPEELLNSIKNAYKSGDTTNATRMMERASTPFARIYTRGLQNYGRPPELIEMAMAHEAANEVTHLEYLRPGLRVLVFVAPMAALAGTLCEMRLVLIQPPAAGTGLELQSIGQSLTPLVGGILISIVSYIFDSYYRNLVRRFLEDAHYYAAELTNFLTGRIAG